MHAQAEGREGDKLPVHVGRDGEYASQMFSSAVYKG